MTNYDEKYNAWQIVFSKDGHNSIPYTHGLLELCHQKESSLSSALALSQVSGVVHHVRVDDWYRYRNR